MNSAPNQNDLSPWITHCLVLSPEAEKELAELYKDAPRITAETMRTLERRAKEIKDEEGETKVQNTSESTS